VLLLVTLGLILASGVLLIVGFVQDTLGFIYVSMLCAGVAGVTLFLFARLAKRRDDALVGARIAGAAATGRHPVVEGPEPASREVGATRESEPPERTGSPEEAWSPEESGATDEPHGGEGDDDNRGDESGPDPDPGR
jgi:hypothetical protein